MIELINEVQSNIQEESRAIMNYNRLLFTVESSMVAEKDEIIAEIEEIISDELNHIERLSAIYSTLTNISANKE